jgi:ribonuclease D
VITVVFRVGRAAVDAPEVAAIRDGDAQVGDLAAEFVVKDHGLLHLLDAVPRFHDALEL